MKSANPYHDDQSLNDAWECGYCNGHGIACHNVPELGAKVFSDALGRVTVDADNIREVHESACFEAELSSRDFSPFEFLAAEFNRSEDADALWEAYNYGVAAAIRDDLASYSDEDYGIPSDDADEES